ncbi:MAG: 6-phosphogluconate dehydrogenase, partial [Chloroflexi bacterium]|nr:6-phosphogluconate dehydrogenase [Chloroflexota bacterium]
MNLATYLESGQQAVARAPEPRSFRPPDCGTRCHFIAEKGICWFHVITRRRPYLDLHQLAALWNHGSVVRSWLLELAESAFDKDPDLSKIRGYVDDSGEGRWTVFEAINENVAAPTIAASLFARFVSRQEDSFAMKVIAALRNEFGGHAV